MTNWKGLTVALTVLYLLAGTVAAHAQAVTESVGFQPNRDYLHLQPWESIDTASGNIVLTFTDLELPGNNGRSLRFQRIFNSQPVASTFDALGRQWRFGISGLPIRVAIADVHVGTYVDGLVAEQQAGARFFMPDGSWKSTTFTADPSTANQAALDATTRFVRTPDFWRFDRIERELRIPDGLLAKYDDSGRLAWFTDPFGNFVYLNWIRQPGHLFVTQRLSAEEQREVDIEVSDVMAFPTRMTYGTRVWDYASEGGTLTGVQPPIGPPWTFEYEGGDLHRVITPQGGTVTYDHDWFTFVTETFPTLRTDSFRTLKTRTGDADGVSGVWDFDYTISGPGGAAAGMTARLPLGAGETERTVVVFGYSPVGDGAALDGWTLTDRQIFKGDSFAPGTMVEWEERHFKLLKAARPSRVWYTHALSLRKVTRSGKSYQTEYEYDSDASTDPNSNLSHFHNPTDVNETGAPGELTRTTHFEWEHSLNWPYMLGLRKSERTTVGGLDTKEKSWSYEPVRRFRESETLYGIKTEFTPDDFGNVGTIRRASGHLTTLTYDWGVLASSTSPGVTMVRGINPDGTIASETVGGRTTTFTYDDLMRPWTQQPPGQSANEIVTTYDNMTGRSVVVERGNSRMTTDFDGFGRPSYTKTEVDSNSSNSIQTRTVYDALGQVAYRSYPFNNATSDAGTSFTYDALGRVLTQTNPGSSRSHSYDDTKNEVTITDENGHATTLTRKAFGHPDDGRLVELEDALGQVWNYEYDTVGNLRKVLSPPDPSEPVRLQREWTYNAKNLLQSEQHPESGMVQYTYDEFGRLDRRQDAKGTVFEYHYDGDDRVDQITAGSQVTTFSFEPGSGNRRTAVVDGVESKFFYDAAGRLGARDDVIAGALYTRRFQYDANDRLEVLTYPSGRVVRYAYDRAGRVTEVRDQTANRSVADSFTYHPSGGVSGYRFNNNITTAISYTPQYWVDTITSGALFLDYMYDAAGNVSRIDDGRPGYSQGFIYDELDRLRRAEGSTQYGVEAYEYFPSGNRRPLNTNNPEYGYYPGTLRMQWQGNDSARRDFSYDANGNLTSVVGTATFTPTLENMIGSATAGGKTTSYLYDADQWRAAKFEEAATSHYLRGTRGELLTELRDEQQGTLAVTDYIYAGSRLLSSVESTRTGEFCRATLTPSPYPDVPTSGAPPQSIQLTIQAGCPWRASTSVNWITGLAPTSGTGPAPITFTVEDYSGTTERHGTLNVAGKSLTITQRSAAALGDTLHDGETLHPGQYLLSLNGLFKFEYYSGGSIGITGPSGRGLWTDAHVDANGFARMEAGRFVKRRADGSEVWAFGTAGHPGAFLAMQSDRNVAIYPEPGDPALDALGTQCIYTVSPPLVTVFAEGTTSGSATVASQTDCPWTASAPSWVHIAAPTSGFADPINEATHTVTFTVDANASVSERQVDVTIGDVTTGTVRILQGGAPGQISGDGLQPGQRLWPGQYISVATFVLKMFPSGITTAVDTTSGAGYFISDSVGSNQYMEMLADGRFATMDVNRNAVWYRPNPLPAGSSGSYLVLRPDGRLQIINTLSQVIFEAVPPVCSYAVSTTSVVHGPYQTEDRISVYNDNPSCHWTSTSDVDWITLSKTETGDGGGYTTYIIAPNGGSDARIAHLTIGGQQVAVQQGGTREYVESLHAGEAIYPGQALVSANGTYRLEYQLTGGNLVLYGRDEQGDFQFLWSAPNTFGTTPGIAVMQDDGNFVVYKSTWGQALWSTGTDVGAGSGRFIALQESDGNLVVYDAGGFDHWDWQSGFGPH